MTEEIKTLIRFTVNSLTQLNKQNYKYIKLYSSCYFLYNENPTWSEKT